MKRRDFFTKGLPSYAYRVTEFFVDEAGLKKKEKPQDYFSSFETAYPFLNEVTYDMLLQSAAQLGIDPKGKTKLQLAKEVYEKRGTVYHDG